MADLAGFGRVVVSDHVAFGENLDAYGDPRVGGVHGGRQPTGPDGHWLEPFTVLAYLAGITTRVRLGTNIMIAALRRPAVLAKQLATLDVLSGGRVDLGVGVGWQRAEYDVAGLEFDRRGRLLDHTLAVCTALWGEQRARFADELLEFDAIHQMPKPLQRGGVPIWVSGTVNDNVIRRLAEYGSGWIPWGSAAADLSASIPAVKRALVARGRDDADDLKVVGHLPLALDGDTVNVEATLEAARPLIDAGVTELQVHLRFTDDVEADRSMATAFVRLFEDALATWR